MLMFSSLRILRVSGVAGQPDMVMGDMNEQSFETLNARFAEATAPLPVG